MKTICKKSWPGYLFQVMNLTFDPASRLDGGPISPFVLVLGLQTVKTAHGKSWPANVLPVDNFGLILKNKMATIANYLKSLRCSKT